MTPKVTFCTIFTGSLTAVQGSFHQGEGTQKEAQGPPRQGPPLRRKSRSVLILFGALLDQASASMLQQLWDDVSDSLLIENNGVASEWGCNPFWSNCIVFNQTSMASVIAALMLILSLEDPKCLCNQDYTLKGYSRNNYHPICDYNVTNRWFCKLVLCILVIKLFSEITDAYTWCKRALICVEETKPWLSWFLVVTNGCHGF